MKFRFASSSSRRSEPSARLHHLAEQLQHQESGEDPYDRLALREKEVLQLIAQGKSNKEIASLLDISINTVAVHRARLMETLDFIAPRNWFSMR